MNKLILNFRNLKRFFTITSVFLNLLIDMSLQRIYFPEHARKISKFRRFWGKFFAFIFRRDIKKVDYPVIFRLALEKLGPTFIKFGQILSLRKDFVPEELCRELEKLQDKVPPMAQADVVKVIELDFREPLYKVFPDFDKNPIGSASLAQIHVAHIDDNIKVAVKVQRPGIRRIVLNDINVLKSLAKILERLSKTLRQYQLSMFVKEFENYTLRELDFKIEGFHAEKFSVNFKDDTHINFPKIYWHKSTSKVLTMQFIEGIKPKESVSLDKYGIDRAKVASIAANAVLKMLFIDGFFHGDPHPGNILITKENKIYFIDLGMIGTFSEKVKNYMFLFYYYMNLENFDNAVNNFCKMLTITKESNLEGFKEELVELIRKFSSSSLENISIARIILDTLQIGVKYNVYFPRDTFLMSKSLITIESIGYMLVPGLKLADITESFVQNIFIERFGFDKMVQSFALAAPDIIDFLRNLPQFTINMVKRLESGQQNINMLNKESQEKAQRRNTTILAKAILIGVFSICGTLFVDFYIKSPDSNIITSVIALPLLEVKIPIVGTLFYVIALLLALSLLYKKDK